MRTLLRAIALLLLVAAPAAAENLVVSINAVLATPDGVEVSYSASPQSGAFTFAGSVVVPYSAANQQITSAIAAEAKTRAAQFNVTVGPGDIVKVFGGPSN